MKFPSYSLLTGLMLMTLSSAAQAQILNPIAVTGFNLEPYFSTTPGDTSGSNGNFQSFNFVVADWNGPGSNGTPLNGVIHSDGNANATFQLAPYDQDNVLALLNSNGSPQTPATGTLTLTTPGVYKDLSFILTTAGSGGAEITFNFAGGNHLTENIGTLPYWVFGDAAPSGGVEASTALQIYQNTNVQLTEYDYALPGTYQYDTLQSVTFAFVPDANNNGPGGSLGIFALSGTAGAAPEPSTYAMLLAGLAVLGFCVRRRESLSK